MLEKKVIRVMLVDDHAILREGLKTMLNVNEDIEVVASAGEGHEALNCFTQCQPDVVIMDIAMPGMNGIEAAKAMMDMRPDTRILILSQHDNEHYILPMLRAGAMGYIAKRAVTQELITAIRTVYRGEPYLEPAIERMMLRDYQSRASGSQVAADEYKLTDRQEEVLKLVAEGHTTSEIAEILHLSPKTVMSHRANIYQRLGTSNLADVIRIALRMELIELESETEASL